MTIMQPDTAFTCQPVGNAAGTLSIRCMSPVSGDFAHSSLSD